ncbi:PREDICTED: olfactory receptor 14C36-like [Condylura cristata]|uniref:olfactory receptor 14C36-like n=1 Tax=Condylura cristata TaxID=143302 RepID=UPI0003344F8A|nr:PREDICTED: olfactory receptor 14C36-like [Condylura cristata]
MTNYTMVTEFLLESFGVEWKLRLLNSVLFLLMYLITLLGNLLIIVATTLDKNLHTPMYFFLRNLSMLDICYISVTVPNACITSLSNYRAISVMGCATQVFLVIYFAIVEIMFLTIMAHDRYVAICQPLHYPVIMSHQFCVRMTVLSLFSGLVYSGVHTGNTFRLSFCQSNAVNQFFCDIPSLLLLSCSDTTSNQILILISAIVVCGGCFIFIAVSYSRIFSTVFKFSKRERGKAFSTCIPHIIVVSVFLTSISYVYLKPSATSETIQDIIPSVLYTIVPPLLNPVIYSLRNKQVKEAVRKVLLRRVFTGKW